MGETDDKENKCLNVLCKGQFKETKTNKAGKAHRER